MIARTGVVLAGGRSRRMGTPKALLELEGRTMLARVAAPLFETCDELVLSVAPAEHAPASFVDALLRALEGPASAPVTVVRDREAHTGPVAGLAASLAASRGALAFVAGCDTPFLATSLVRGLLALAEGDASADVVLPVRDERPEPLLAVYRVATMAPHLARRRDHGGGRLADALEQRRVVRVSGDELLRLDPSGGSFRNVNDARDFRRALAHLAEARSS